MLGVLVTWRRKLDVHVVGEGVGVMRVVEVATMEVVSVAVDVVFVDIREVMVEVRMDVNVVVRVEVVVRLIIEVWSCVIGWVNTSVDVAWNVFVVLTMIIGVMVVSVVLVRYVVDGGRVMVFPTTPNCWQAVEYDFTSRHSEA